MQLNLIGGRQRYSRSAGLIVRLWSAAWKRVAPRVTIAGTALTSRSIASTAAMRAMLAWRADWKTEAVAKILEYRKGSFIDVGANVGQSLLDFLCAPARSSYLGFEPNLTCCRHLATFIAENRADGCRVIPAGLANRNGLGTLYRLGGDVDSGATTLKALRPRGQVIAEPCCLFRLDDLSAQLAEPEIALIKIDTEGTELEVLQGMEATICQKRPWVLCEVLHRDEMADPALYRHRCAELMRLVTSLGYRAQRIVHDVAGIKSLEAVSEFPDQVWNDRSISLCDYLLVPDAEVQLSHKVLVATRPCGNRLRLPR